MKNRNIVEIAGLSGVGKSTSTRKINELLPHEMISWGPKIYRLFQITHIDKLFLIATEIRFKVLLKELRNSMNTCQGHHCPDMIETSINEILPILNRICILYFIARFEVLVRNVSVVIDDGFIQRGLSIWLRSPITVRDTIVKIYYDRIPKKHVCMLIDCELDEILKRSRARGVRSIFRRNINEKNDENELYQLYSKMKSIFKEQSKLSCVQPVHVERDSTVDDQAQMIYQRIKEKLSSKRIVTWVCC